MYNNFDKFSLLTDFYEITMMNGYLNENMQDQIAYFEYYFRQIPEDGGYAISCGLESFVKYIQSLEFSSDEIEMLREKNFFTDAFLDNLSNYKFTGDIWAIPEGTPVFANEPLVIVKGRIFEVQLVETALLIFFNHQSLIATKASRMVRAAKSRAIMEFGARRAQGVDASVMGARSAYIGGCVATSNLLADKEFGIPSMGTMAHSWVQMFESEYDAFVAYAKSYPDNCNLLIDTYDVFKSGLPNAIKVFEEVLKPMGKRPTGVRIDSGDIAYITKKVRKILDESGYEDCGIVVSNSMDEIVIRNLLLQDAQINAFGIGERLITARSQPVFGGVYKLVATEKDGKIVNKIKISETFNKITTPGFKQLWRLFDKKTDKAMADLVSFHDEEINGKDEMLLFDPIDTWKKKKIKDFYAVPMLKKIFENGELIYEMPSLSEIRKNCEDGMAYLWDEVKRFDKPHKYVVDLSYDLWKTKTDMIKKPCDK